MAMRNTPAKRVPGDPLAGVLRQTARMARRPRRNAIVAVEEKEPAPPETPVAAPPGITATGVAMLVTGETGVAVWDAGPGTAATATVADGGPALVTVQQSATGVATVRTWTVQGEPLPGTTVVAVAFPLPDPAPDVD